MRDAPPIQLPPPWTRRRFLRSACAAVGTTSLASTIFDLRRIAAAATAPINDFHALVCVFLYGGNDANNTVVPYGALPNFPEYTAYAAARGSLALPRAALRPLALPGGQSSDGRIWALHPSLAQLQALFTQQKVAIVGNVGPLVAPLSLAEYNAGSAAVPPQLFSHSDQTLHWQTSLPDQPLKTGWGGRVADLLNTAANPGGQVSMSLSLGGTNTFQIGDTVTQYQISPYGGVGLDGYSDGTQWNDPASTYIRQVNQQQAYPNLFQQGYRNVFDRALKQDAALTTALAAAPLLSTQFPDTNLGHQLGMVARLVAARGGLGLQRQVFFVSADGYDTHGEQVGAQATIGAHADLLGELDASLAAFYAATVELGLADKVTTFTASDFGRTFVSNGNGTDHGWGSHHFVMGGGVVGGHIYGTMPELAVDGADDVGDGRWIPTTAVDEYAATLARWFGVSSGDMPTVLPNLGRFANPDLGFLG